MRVLGVRACVCSFEQVQMCVMKSIAVARRKGQVHLAALSKRKPLFAYYCPKPALPCPDRVARAAGVARRWKTKARPAEGREGDEEE